jgi:ribosomal protein S18 acetylase RimI-like enzyme
MPNAPISLPGQQTLIASWTALAGISPGARLSHSAAATAALFPSWAPLNNAILKLTVNDRHAMTAVSELKSTYAGAGVGGWALWVPSTKIDLDAPDDVYRLAGFRRDTTTLVMQADLRAGLQRHDGVVSTSIPVATRAGDESVPVADLGEPETEPGLSGWVLVHGDVAVAGAWSFLREEDCGIYAVGTAPGWRRRGVARNLVEHVLADAHCGGARTATLQSTRMAQHLYRSLGFEPAGRYEEWLCE